MRLLTLHIFLCLAIPFFSHAEGESPRATLGVLDLRSWDFETDGIVRLDGTWGFYWNELLTPGDLASYTSAVPHYYCFPCLWNNASVDGMALSNQGFATYTLTVLMPPGYSSLSLTVEDFYTSYKLFINGIEFSTNGIVGTSRESSLPEWKPLTKPLRAEADTLHLVLQIANFEHRKGGASQGISLGTEMHINRARDVELAYNWILAGAMFMGGLFFFGLYLFGRHDRAMFFFALFCIVYSYRNIGTDLYAINSLVEGLPWTVIVRLEHISVLMGLYFFVQYLISLYPEEVYKPALNTFLWMTLTLAALTMTGPVWLFTTILPYYLYVLLLAIAYGAYVVVMAALHKRPAARYALAGKLTVFAVVGYNALAYFSLVPRMILFNFMAHLTFFFCQGLVLSFRFAHHLKESRQKAEKASQAKTEFLSSMSHEMRTPLNAVLGMTNYLLQDAPKEEQKENLHTLKYSAEHLMMLISDVLDFSKIETGNITFVNEETSLRHLLRSIHESHLENAREKGINFQLIVGEEVPDRIVCDKGRLLQVLTNIVDNALKFTSEGFVHLKVSVDNKEGSRVQLLFEVIDSGIGIAPSQREVIFESFSQANASTTREYGGTGLGLAIIRRLLQLQGSDIELTSSPGEGSRFYFRQWFEAKENSLSPEQAQGAGNSTDNGVVAGKKILVVEDNKVNVLVIKKFLKKWGAEVEIADNGQLAVEKYLSATFDLILMDLQMPVMDGYEATRKIREKDGQIPIIAITAAVPSDTLQQIYGAGMNDIVTKPFVPEDLQKKLIKYLSTNS